jgi:hypothetical protein
VTVGTKSLLFGAHLWCLHPFFVALAWLKLYGFRRVTCPSSGVRTSLLDPRLWLCFLVHDWGYWGCPNMDGPEGEQHPRLGASIVSALLDGRCTACYTGSDRKPAPCFWGASFRAECHRWYFFAFYHSRFLAKRCGYDPSLLCAADKLAIALEPRWLYLPRVIATGEIREYMKLAQSRKLAGEPLGKYGTMSIDVSSARAWHRSMCSYVRRWAYEHRDGKADTWTPDMGAKTARDAQGVWQ